jgi:acetolactate decarboxylase
MLDERLVTALHVEALRRDELAAEHEAHVLFQASTIAALLQGAYDGDVTFGELAEHGDLGLGTLNGLDGEMIALDGRFYRADVDGGIHPVPATARTPFAVVVWFQSSVEFEVEFPAGDGDLEEVLEARLPAGAGSCAIRVDADFSVVRARSVPKQATPYRPLAEVVAEQNVFELHDVSGSLVGFRFPDYAEGVEVSGYHLHFISRDRSRGGHVLSCALRRARVEIDPSTDLHLELPPGVDLDGPELTESTRKALHRAEHAG